MKFRVRTLPRAEADIRCITNYIHKRSPSGAAAWVSALDRARKWLADNADSCSQAHENDHFDIEVQQSLFKTRRGRIYRLVFTIVNDEVRVLRIRGSGQASIEPDDLELTND